MHNSDMWKPFRRRLPAHFQTVLVSNGGRSMLHTHTHNKKHKRIELAEDYYHTMRSSALHGVGTVLPPRGQVWSPLCLGEPVTGKQLHSDETREYSG